MNGAALAVGLFGAALTVRALVIGGASADGQGFRRDDEPLAFWAIIGAGTIACAALIYVGLGGAIPSAVRHAFSVR